jgi:hypothetical protein
MKICRIRMNRSKLILLSHREVDRGSREIGSIDRLKQIYIRMT